MKGLTGIEKDVAVQSYVGALRGLFLAGVALALGMVIIQAGTGWKAGVESSPNDVDEVGNGRGVEDEEWEEGMEQGV